MTSSAMAEVVVSAPSIVKAIVMDIGIMASPDVIGRDNPIKTARHVVCDTK